MSTKACLYRLTATGKIRVFRAGGRTRGFPLLRTGPRLAFGSAGGASSMALLGTPRPRRAASIVRVAALLMCVALGLSLLGAGVYTLTVTS